MSDQACACCTDSTEAALLTSNIWKIFDRSVSILHSNEQCDDKYDLELGTTTLEDCNTAVITSPVANCPRSTFIFSDTNKDNC